MTAHLSLHSDIGFGSWWFLEALAEEHVANLWNCRSSQNSSLSGVLYSAEVLNTYLQPLVYGKWSFFGWNKNKEACDLEDSITHECLEIEIPRMVVESSAYILSIS